MAATIAMPRLGRANEVRLARRELLDELRFADSRIEAQERCAELLVACEPALDTLSVFDLVRQCRRLGKDSARKLISDAGISDPNIPIGDILYRDAKRLGQVLRGEVV